MMGLILRFIGCDLRWMVVELQGFEPYPVLVRHYLGKPSFGWEMFDMAGPFETEEAARLYTKS